jgi:hypothetical protein
MAVLSGFYQGSRNAERKEGELLLIRNRRPLVFFQRRGPAWTSRPIVVLRAILLLFTQFTNVGHQAGDLRVCHLAFIGRHLRGYAIGDELVQLRIRLFLHFRGA